MTGQADPAWGANAPRGIFAALLARARAGDGKMLARVASWFAPKAVDVETLGFKARLHPGDNLSEKRILYTPGRFDPVELAHLSAALHPDFVFVDIGANCGAYTLHLAVQAASGARFYAIEAQPEMAHRFRFNLAASDIAASVQLDELALSDTRGEIAFTVNRHNRGESGLEGGGETIRVPALPLADYVAERNVTSIDALKIDVEGQEHRILAPFFASTPETAWPRILVVEQLLATPEKDPVQLALSHGYTVVRDLGRNVILERAGGT
ncbi:FkbM family methyltransferase [Hyphobacterium sp.]|uniref:FkbM family methyltransferase n=1 Tax=Hyphobacterium sp. TaxID=2004662 RepID=UPI003BAD6B94